MRSLLITAAGTSSRFSQSLGKVCLKCIYYPENIKESLLYHMLWQDREFDKYIIVGGFMFAQLKETVEREFSDLREKIILVNNVKYAEYGSGYSLYKGLEEILKMDFDELVFAEGDLFVDKVSFRKVVEAPKDVITSNTDPILAEKAVAFYYDGKNCIHYIYDTCHSMLEIKEPFRAIYNSGQIWKFTQPDLMRRICGDMQERDWQGTNLVFIQKYFQELGSHEYDIIQFKKWINCNTISDYEKIRKGIW